MGNRQFKTREIDPETQARNAAVMVKILGDLPGAERNALMSFYCDQKSEKEVQTAFAFDTERFREMRRSTRVMYFQRTALAAAPFAETNS